METTTGVEIESRLSPVSKTTSCVAAVNQSEKSPRAIRS